MTTVKAPKPSSTVMTIAAIGAKAPRRSCQRRKMMGLFINASLRGRCLLHVPHNHSGRKYRLGDRARIVVPKASLEARKIDFRLVREEDDSAGAKPPPPRGQPANRTSNNSQARRGGNKW